MLNLLPRFYQFKTNLKKVIFLMVLVCGCASIKANPDSLFIKKIDSIALQLYSVQPDSIKLAANAIILEHITAFLKTPQSIAFPFDSLKFVKVVTPSNSSFKLITWVFPLSDKNQYHYSGLIQHLKDNMPNRLTELRQSYDEPNPFLTYRYDQWPPAVYYQLIESKTKSGTLFTLFGWVGGTQGEAARVIETLSFNENHEALFGVPAFKLNKETILNRVYFNYSNEVPFHLAYEQHYVPGKKRKKAWMIVHNRLVNSDPNMGNAFRFSLPSYSEFDGFIFSDNCWQQVKDIDVRIKIKSAKKKKQPKTGLFPND